MRFARAIWKLLVGVKDALVLIFMLLFFGMLYALLSIRPEAVTDGVLALELDGTVVEQPERASWTSVAGGSVAKEHRLRDLVGALDEARGDDRVKAVALDLEGFLGGGQVAMADLSDAIRRVRDSGKPVVAYSVGYTNDGYQLASAASEVWINPLGLVALAGPGGSNLYFKGLLDKLGVTAHVYRVGTYKSAVEPFIRNDMSDEARANYLALGEAMLESWRDSVRRARPAANIDLMLRDLPGAIRAANGDLAGAALNAKLVDKIADRQAFEARLAEIGGEGDTPEGYRRIELDDYIGDAVDRAPRGPIGVVTVAGNIVDGKASEGTAGGDSIALAIEQGLQDDGLKALVVRVDSPGGSVIASERIRQAILQAKAKKLPVVVSMGNVAASGGYWVATPADFIFAEPSTITGSIGVFGVLPSFEGTLQKLGIGADGIKTTPLSGEPNLFEGPSPEVNQVLQASVESTYRRFLSVVAQSRRKTPQQIDAIAQGRVWDGGTARQLGLVDGFGGMDEAIAKAGELAKLGEGNREVRYLERPLSFKDSILAMLTADELDDGSAPPDAFATIGGDPQGQLVRAVAELRSIVEGPRIQVRCLECVSDTPVRLRPADRGLLAMLAQWLS